MNPTWITIGDQVVKPEFSERASIIHGVDEAAPSDQPSSADLNCASESR